METDFYQNKRKYLDEMRDALAAFRKLVKDDPEKARDEARRSLIESGVLNFDGSHKDQIVTLGISG